MKTKTKKISFRIDEVMYDFMKKISMENNTTISDMSRKILEYFFIGYLIGEFKKPLNKLRDEFLEKFEYLKNNKENNNTNNKK